MTWLVRWWLAAVLVVAALAYGRDAAASRGGRIAISVVGGGAAPLELRPKQGEWDGEFTITNVGGEPLTVSRIALQGTEDDLRSPPRLSVRFVDGASTSATIAPGVSKDVVVSWVPDKDTRARQAFGHVVVTSSDEGGGEMAMGFYATLPSGLGGVGAHALSILVLWPLSILLVVAIAHFFPLAGKASVAHWAVGISAFELILAAWAYRNFVPDLGRIDGNDGFQMIERWVWIRSIGCEWYLGVDGASIGLVLLAAIVFFVTTIVASGERRGAGHLASLALLFVGINAALVALDLVVLFAAWEIVWIASVLLVGGSGDASSRRPASRLGVAGLVGSAALLVAFAALSRGSGPTYLVDGTRAVHAMAVPELSRASFVARPPIAGFPLVDVAWMGLFVAVAALSPVVPLHRWLPDALEHGSAAGGIAVAAAAVALGPYLLVRIGLEALPEGARWAGASIATFGALGALWGALCAMVQRRIRRFVAYTTIAASGIALYGIGTLTEEGIAGGLMGLFAHGLSVVLVLGCAASIDARVHSRDVTKLRGRIVRAPAMCGLLAVGLAVSAGVPGLVGSWSTLLAILGGFVRYPILAVVLAAAVAVSVAAHVRLARLVFAGGPAPTVPDDDTKGRTADDKSMPDISPSELVALVPMAVLAFVLGVWPAPILSSIAVGARDCSVAADPDGPDAAFEKDD